MNNKNKLRHIENEQHLYLSINRIESLYLIRNIFALHFIAIHSSEIWPNE